MLPEVSRSVVSDGPKGIFVFQALKADHGLIRVQLAILLLAVEKSHFDINYPLPRKNLLLPGVFLKGQWIPLKCV